MAALNVTVQGKGKVTLSQNDFVASGGEGSVYAKAGTGYKIYNDPSKMIPVAKIGELSVLTEPNINRPIDIIVDSSGSPIGYTMRFITDAVALCQLFPKAYRDRNHITPQMTLKLVQRLQHLWEHVISKGCLIVDGNEMNFLVTKKHDDIYAIDVDSYQTRSFPATAIMESVRDRHAKKDARGRMILNAGTDWFAFAITSFQMFIGIHPFKGRHPKVADMDDRMLKNISVLNPEVTFPKGACQPFSVIPPEYMAWYKSVFEQGERSSPPSGSGAAVTVAVQVTRVKGSQNFEIKEVFTLPETIVDHMSVNGVKVTLTTTGLYANAKKIQDVTGDVSVGVTKKMSHVILGRMDGKRLTLHDATANSPLDLTLDGEGLTAYEGRLYFKAGLKVYEIEFLEMAAGRVIASACPVANVMEKSSKVFDGVVVQNIFGKHYATFFPASKQSREVKIEQVSGQVVDAKFESNVLMVVAVDAKGKYNRYVFRFAKDYGSYDVRVFSDITFTGLNFVVLDNGVCVTMTEQEEIELTRNAKDDPTVKVIPDNQINGDVKLFKEGTTVLFAKGDALYSMTMKK
jgi:hypothetical protein